MLAATDSVAALASHWLAALDAALERRDAAALRALFHPDCHWRDVLGLGWHIRTASGRDAVVTAMLDRATQARPAHFEIDPGRTPPRHATRAGTKCVEAIFRFETAVGRASGVLRLLPGEEAKAWTLFTALEEIKGDGVFSQYPDPEPTVLVVGGGHAGLSAAARLARLGIATRIVDRWPRVGDNWRRRYDALTLHNQVHVN